MRLPDALTSTLLMFLYGGERGRHLLPLIDGIVLITIIILSINVAAACVDRLSSFADARFYLLLNLHNKLEGNVFSTILSLWLN